MSKRLFGKWSKSFRKKKKRYLYCSHQLMSLPLFHAFNIQEHPFSATPASRSGIPEVFWLKDWGRAARWARLPASVMATAWPTLEGTRVVVPVVPGSHLYGTSGRFWQILARASQTELHVAPKKSWPILWRTWFPPVRGESDPIGAAGLPAISELPFRTWHLTSAHRFPRGHSHGCVESAESNGSSEETVRCF